MKEDNIVVSVSGGRSSMLMAIFLQEFYRNAGKKVIYVFANTGKEHIKTLEFIKKCDEYFKLGIIWLECVVNPIKGKGNGYKIVNFETADRTGKPFHDIIKKLGIPNKSFRHCTRDLKIRTIKKYCDKIFGVDNYVKCIGIRADEKHRLGKNNPNIIYPLDGIINVDKTFVLNWWARQPFDLEIKEEEGNCDLCFLKSTRKKMTVLKNTPDVGIWWADMEMIYSDFIRPRFDIRDNLDITDLIEMAKSPFKEFKENDVFDPLMDTEFNCYCKSSELD